MTVRYSRAHHIRKPRLALCVLLLCAGMTACGQIGPLYLPGEEVQDELDTTSPISTGDSEDDSDEEEGSDDQ